MLIPFLDILCSLIGVLVLIIVVLVVAQTQRISGRTKEEIERAQEHLTMQKLRVEYQKKYEGSEEKVQALERLEEQSASKKEEIAKLKELLENADSLREENKKAANQFQVELDKLVTEIRGLSSQEPDLKRQKEALLAAIEKLKPPENKDANVQIKPPAKGGAASVFFVDTSGGKLTFFWNEKEKYTVSAVPETIVADTAFNAFLQAARNVPQSKLVFLIRADGMGAYNLAAGWAQSKYNYPVEQMGRMLVPGQGNLDLSAFGKTLGSLPGPPPPRTSASPSPAPAPPAPAAPQPPAQPATPPASPQPAPK